MRLLLLPILLCLILIGAISTAAPLRVVIDPGHGGKDTGAKSNGLTESKLVLKVAEELHKMLAADPRFHPSLTRSSHAFRQLGERVSIAHQKDADVLLSIHANYSPDPRAKGLEVYFQNQLSPDEEVLFLANLEHSHEGHQIEAREDKDKVTPLPKPHGFSESDKDVQRIIDDLQRSHKISKSGQLAKSIATSWKGFRKKERNTIRQFPFFVVSHSEIPAVLVEVGFVSNQREARKLKNKNYQKLIAESLFKGLIDFKESIDPKPLN